MGHMLTPRYGAIQGFVNNGPYTQDLRTFFAVPGVSGTDRLKIRPPADADAVEIRRKQKDTEFSGKSLLIDSQDTAPINCNFSSNGLIAYVLGQANKTIYQYNLSVAWDISTGSYTGKSFYVGGYDTNTRTFALSTDGTKLFTLGWLNDTIYQFTLGIIWDISTVSYSSKSYTPGSMITDGCNLTFKPDGTKFYLTNYDVALNNHTYQYSCSTARDISTANYDNKYFDFSGQYTRLCAFTFSKDGLIGWGLDYSTTTLYRYNFTVAWDISTAVYSGKSFSIGSQITAPMRGGISIDTENNRYLYITNNVSSDTILQYDIGYGAWNESDDRTSGILVGVINEYSSGTTYSKDDWVIYNGEVYICIQAGTGQQPDIATTYWTDAGDIDNNIWYDVTGLTDGTRYFYKAFPAKHGVYYEANYLPSSCIHEYLLDGNAVDRVGDADGIEVNITYETGVLDEASVFNGSSSYIDLGSPSDFDRTVKTAGNGCAYECWLYVDSWGSDNGIGANRAIVDQNGWNCIIQSGQSGGITSLKYDGTNIYYAGATGLSLNTWYHCVMNVYSDNSIEFFINGTSVDRDIDTTIPQNSTDGMSIGGDPAPAQYWDGKIDQVRFYVGALSQEQITELYQQSDKLHPNETEAIGGGLSHEYDFDNISGSTMYDTAGSSNLTNTNVTYVDGEVGDAGDYNGSNARTALSYSIVSGRNTDYSFALKVKTNNINLNGIMCMASFTNNIRRELDINSTYGITYTWYSTSSVNRRVSYSDVVTGEWYDVVITHNHGVDTRLYVDGVLRDIDAYTGGENPQYEFGYWLGFLGTPLNSYWDGEIDQIRFYNGRVLIPYEITNLYNKGRGC